MNSLKKIFIIFLLFFSIVLLFKYNYLLQSSVLTSLNLWINKVFPSLFIMFIINDIIVNTNILNFLDNIFSPLFNKIFNTSGNTFSLFILSTISGSPTNAYIINESLKNKNITNKTAQKLMTYTYFSNPLFLYNILKSSFNNFIIFKIIFFHYFANIITGIILRFNGKDDPIKINNSINNQNILLIIPKSISKSINTLLMILGCITFYMIISNILIKITSLNPVLIKGILEITQGLHLLNTLKYKSILKEIIAIALISFGGLSIHTQVLALINDKNLYKCYFKGRIYQMLISTSTYLFFYIITLHI